MRFLIPNFEYKDVTHIDSEIFKDKKLLIFDIDNTLFYPESTNTREDIVKWFKKANKKHHCICLSNSNTIKRRKSKIMNLLDCEIYISKRKKPSKRLFKTIQSQYKVNASEIIIIGDMRFTDITFGNRNGATTVLVRPLGPEKLKRIKIARFIENSLVFGFQWFRK